MCYDARPLDLVPLGSFKEFVYESGRDLSSYCALAFAEQF
jgi:hypothetical protein